MRVNYVLIDYENVQPTELTGLDAEYFRVVVFLGANQKRLSTQLVTTMQRLGTRGSYVVTAGNGANALDFHIAFYIGDLAAKDPKGFFHVISKDAGFDPLIRHLKERNILASRCEEIGEIPILKPTGKSSIEERTAAIVANLAHRGNSRPRTLKTLRSTVHSLFQKQLSNEELDLLMKWLEKKRIVAVHDNKLTYNLPESAAVKDGSL